jgi:magnesium transporter
MTRASGGISSDDANCRGVAGSVEWIDLVDPDEQTLNTAMRTSTHPLAIEQLLAPKTHQDDPRPMLEEHDGYVFGVFLAPRLDLETGEVGYREIDLVLAPDGVLSVRKTCPHHGLFDTSEVRRLHEEGRVGDPGMLAYRLIDEIAESFLTLTDRLNVRIDELEDHIEDWSALRVRSQLSALRHEMLHIRRVLAPTRDAVRRVIDNRIDIRLSVGELFHRDVEIQFGNAFDKLLRASEAIDLCRDLVAGVRDYHQSKISNDQNEVMKRLTVIASLLLLPAFIVGLYGMNIKGIPEYRLAHGYVLVWGLIIATTIAQVVYFRRKRWI